MYCGKCGSPIPNGDSFCSKCGAHINQNVAQAGSVINSQPVPPNVQTPKPRNTALKVIETIFAIVIAIIIMIIAMRSCSIGMLQMGY